MRRWLILAALAFFVLGCQSTPHPRKEKVEKSIWDTVPNGEASPFGP